MSTNIKYSQIKRYIPAIFLISFLFACVEPPLDPEELARPLPTVGDTDIKQYGAHTVMVSGNVQSEGTSAVTSRGFCWSESENPTVEDNTTPAGSGTGEFDATIKGLQPGTTYYIRPYATNSNGSSYGPAESITTLNIPAVATADITDITPNSAVSGGTISDDGEVEILARGVAWSTSENPTVQDDTTRDGSGPGEFTSTLTDLTPGVSYYVRAYATYADSTQYGNQIQFATTGFNLSGKVTKDGTGLAGVTITASGGHDQTVDTDENGEYQITGIEYNSTVTITPTYDGYSFSPSERTIESISHDTSGIDFSASIGTYSISGTVTKDGSGLGGVTITASGGHSQTVTTNSNGVYTLIDVVHRSTNITITPSLAGHNFTPEFRTIDGPIISNVTGRNFSGVYEWTRDTDTEIVDVLNPATGKTWMDRNLGASRAATSSTDAQAYGHLYQWGRAADGHQVRTSGTTSTLSNSDTPGHGDFITVGSSPYDWRSPQNDNLWQGVNGTNNPCPSGYRLPTEAEWEAERQSWSSNDRAGAFASPLKLPVAGYRLYSNGSLLTVGSSGHYWSSTVDGTNSRNLYFHSTNANMYSDRRAYGHSVRCLKD